MYHLTNVPINQCMYYLNNVLIVINFCLVKVITNDTTVNGGFNSIQSGNMTEMITHMSSGYQTINIESQEYFHLAVDGQTFGIIREYYPQIFERVRHNITLPS